MKPRRRRNPDPTSLRELVPGVMKGMRGAAGPSVGRVREVWPKILGSKLAARTRVTRLKGGTLTVEVASAALKHDLATFRREEVLQGLKERLPEFAITRVNYRVGAVS